MNVANSSSMEEIPLDDVDRSSMEYKVLMAYAQRCLSASKYEQLLKEEANGPVGASPCRARGDVQVGDLGGERNHQESSSPEDQKQPAGKKSREKKKKKKEKTTKSIRKRLQFFPCLRAQTDEEVPKRTEGKDTVNGHEPRSAGYARPLQEVEGDPALVADRLAEIVDSCRSSEEDGFRRLGHSVSLQEDGGPANEARLEGVDGKDEEENIINTIVALLRKSGDELQEKMSKGESAFQCVGELMSYQFFKRVTNQVLEETLVGNSAMDSETQNQSTKVAFAMEVTTRLSAVSSHPMNIVLGFGAKYLQENFSHWIYSQGGWVKAFGLPNHEKVE